MRDDNLHEHVTASETVYSGRILNVRLDDVRLANGRTGRREIVEHAPVVAMVPVDEAGNVVLVRQYRLPAEEALLEIPAGGVDGGESIEEAAQRELREETGLAAASLERLTGFYVSPGYVTEFIHVFFATGLTESPLEGDHDEQIETERVPLAEAVQLARDGGIKDAKSIIGLLLAADRPS